MPARVNHASNRFAALMHNELNSSAILARCSVPELKELRVLRAMGWKNDEIDAHFAWQRERSDAAPVKAQWGWFQGMIGILQELDVAAAFLPSSGTFEFLDIGCAPGGFSTHILCGNPDARGVGISLSESQGGHPLLLSPEYAPRYQYIEQDLLEYDLSSTSTSVSNLSRLPDAFFNRFQLVLLDGHPLRTYRASDNSTDAPIAPSAYGGILLVSQLIIALASVQAGGTLVVKLTHIECSPAAPILYLLDAISDTLVVHKPHTMHASRASFYAVAKGVGAGERAALKERYLAGLQDLWRELRTGGLDGGPRRLTEGDLGFVVTPEKILDTEGYLQRLVELGRPVWATQAQGLRAFLDKKGVQGFGSRM